MFPLTRIIHYSPSALWLYKVHVLIVILKVVKNKQILKALHAQNKRNHGSNRCEIFSQILFQVYVRILPTTNIYTISSVSNGTNRGKEELDLTEG